ncbi:hypothetical protein SEA_UTZCHIPS_53 [Microbacterium phage UtzChips]|nr:hypothetical protein SEA_UTZCHIPS_53 [Microbacterium phage UtzChips]
MTAPIVHAFDRKPLTDEKLASVVDSFDYFGGVSVVIGTGKTTTPGDLWERVAERTPSGSNSELRIRSAHIGRGPLAVDLVGTEPLRTAGRLAA